MVGLDRLSVVKRGLACSRAAEAGFGVFLLLHVEVWKSCEEGEVACLRTCFINQFDKRRFS
jgi:hypothetical protein